MKKIFCIFSVVLILIMAAVPSFAVQPSFIYSWIDNYLGSRTDVSVLDDGSFVCTIIESGDSYIAFYGSPLINDSRSYLISCLYESSSNGYVNVLTALPGSVSVVGSVSKGVDFSVIYTGSFDRVIFDNSNSTIGYTYNLKYFTVIDLNSIYGDNIPDLDQIHSDLDGFYNSSQTPSGSSYHMDLIDFYSHLPEVWNFGSFFTYGYFPLIFVTACLSILLVTFIIILIFRRCRS